MSRLPHTTIHVLLLAAGLGAGTAALAKEPAEKAAPPLARDYPSLCADMVKPFLNDPRYQPVLSVAPIDQARICACLETPLRKDQYIGPLFTTSGEHLTSLDRDRFSTYFATKITSEIMVCFGNALSQSTEKYDPHPLKSE